jgi:DNA-binding transcriptional LysR family regulator
VWDTVELRELRVLVALADELHFGRTAERLNLTQGRVSQTIRRLETVLGGKLVERTSRRVAMTRDGAALVERMRPLIADIEATLQAAHEAIGAVVGTLRLGVVSPPTAGPRFLSVVRAFEERYPACRLQVRDIVISDALGPLRRGEVDALALRLPLDRDDLEIGPILADEPRALAVARSHPLAARASISIEDLAEHRVAQLPGLPPELSEAIVPERTPSGAAIARHPHTPETIAELVAMVARGEIVHPTSASLLDYVAHPDVVLVPIDDMAASRTALVWRASSADARVAALATVVADVVPQPPFRKARAMTRPPRE